MMVHNCAQPSKPSIFFIVSAITLLVGCSKTPTIEVPLLEPPQAFIEAPILEPQKPLSNTLEIRAGSMVNYYNSSANPLVLSIYQLSSSADYVTSGFWQLLENDQSAPVAASILQRYRLDAVYPNEVRQVSLDLLPQTRYLGVFGEFNDPQSPRFSAITAIDKQVLDAGLLVTIDQFGVAVSAIVEQSVIGESQ
jgi:type VI secretion system VasD/TssJ family lipoprotein